MNSSDEIANIADRLASYAAKDKALPVSMTGAIAQKLLEVSRRVARLERLPCDAAGTGDT
jgi:hypothetical protein